MGINQKRSWTIFFFIIGSLSTRQSETTPHYGTIMERKELISFKFESINYDVINAIN